MSDPVFADLGPRPAWRSPGETALKFLHDVTTQDLAGLAPGHGALTAVLDPKGRLKAVLRVLATGDGAFLDADPAAEDVVSTTLRRIAPLAGARLQPDPRRLFRVAGRPADLDALTGPGEHDHAEVDGAVVVRVAWGGDGFDVLAAPEHEDRWRGRLAGVALKVVPAELEPARIRDGRPIFGIDLDDTMLVNETPLVERAVSFSKGCYPGQESVARVRNLGHVRRLICVLGVDGMPPPAGAIVADAAGDDVGRITSVAADAGGALALAIVSVEAAQSGGLSVAGAPASVLP